MRGYLLYVLEITQKAERFEILSTNLQPFFWDEVKTVIRQNKKGHLAKFLFQMKTTDLKIISSKDTQIQLNDFEKRIFRLEKNTTLNQYYADSESNFRLCSTFETSELIEIIKKGFHFATQKKISLKNYYQGEGKFSLFQLKKYKIKYESIRRTAEFKKFNPKL